MKIIFLDIDGVLNTAEGWFHYDRIGEDKDDADGRAKLDPRACANLRYVFDKMPDAKLIIHSSWRRIMPLEVLTAIMHVYGVCDSSKVIGITNPRMSKEDGIREMVTVHGATHYAVIEDHKLGIAPENLIQVEHPYVGFTIIDAFRTLDALGYVERHPMFLF